MPTPKKEVKKPQPSSRRTGPNHAPAGPPSLNVSPSLPSTSETFKPQTLTGATSSEWQMVEPNRLSKRAHASDGPSSLNKRPSIQSASNPSLSPPMVNPTATQEQQPTAVRPPPPIQVKNISNISNLNELLQQTVGNNYSLKSSLNSVAIRTLSSDEYRKIVKMLEENKFNFNFYQLPEEKPYRIAIRNLHPSTPVDLLKEELEQLGFQVLKLHNVIQPRTKVALPIFFVDLRKVNNVSEVFTLKVLQHTLVKIEEPYKTRSLPQCKNCQDLHHTSNYCRHPARCVKCGKGHSTPDCLIKDRAQVNCALCGGSHQANYKGCPSYQEALRRRKAPPSNSSPPLRNFFAPLVDVSQELNQDELSSESPTPQPLRPPTRPKRSRSAPRLQPREAGAQRTQLPTPEDRSSSRQDKAIPPTRPPFTMSPALFPNVPRVSYAECLSTPHGHHRPTTPSVQPTSLLPTQNLQDALSQFISLITPLMQMLSQFLSNLQSIPLAHGQN